MFFYSAVSFLTMSGNFSYCVTPCVYHLCSWTISSSLSFLKHISHPSHQHILWTMSHVTFDQCEFSFKLHSIFGCHVMFRVKLYWQYFGPDTEVDYLFQSISFHSPIVFAPSQFSCWVSNMSHDKGRAAFYMSHSIYSIRVSGEVTCW